MYRCDRSLLSSSSTRGESVLIAVNKKCISSTNDIDVELLGLCFVFVKINNTKNVIVGCIFFPPNSPSSLYNEYFSILDNLISSSQNYDLLFGDFNLPNLNKHH